MASARSRGPIEFIYEGFMVILAFAAVATIWYETRYEDAIVWGTWGIFFGDFCIRFYKAQKKWQFIKAHPFMVIAVIPLDAIFQMARIARVLHFLRLKAMTKYYTKPAIKLIEKQKLTHIIPAIFLIVFISTIPLYMAEGEKLNHYAEAWVGSIASIIFFGYAYVDPETTIGTIIITLLSVCGVVLHTVAIRFILYWIRDTYIGRKAEKKLNDFKN
ncbi:hypothetical protein [Alkalicoccus halolimnae]|uniref:Voltage-gated potassium channel n=1 Tax=Alkalicoccus halolimnae TaxID=1667239 RepID=A0A5C7FBI0_9BACI|nr:hypothetical protein [Alkalicoccus halolimnae]TXF83954.1 hypothetical protein FTX54_11730 [Alkalicoccus halolimnae]